MTPPRPSLAELEFIQARLQRIVRLTFDPHYTDTSVPVRAPESDTSLDIEAARRDDELYGDNL